MESGAHLMLSIEFDDLIYALQRSGGASVYWREVTTRVAQTTDFSVTHVPAARWKRGVPAWSSADVFHSSHFRVCAMGGARSVSTVHDLNYELGLTPPGIASRINLLERKASYFTADALICISENTRSDLLRVYPSLGTRCPIVVIHHGLTRFDAAPREDDEDGRAAPYLLWVGGRKTYKNFITALEGYSSSGVWRDGVRLICTGAPFDEDERRSVAALGLDGLVAVLEHVSHGRLSSLYRNAHCLLYTSTYEGFGLPPLEAMGCGCPVVAANASSIPEVTGDAAILVAPTSRSEVAKAILELQDPRRRAEFISKGRIRSLQFSWDESARRHVGVYRGLVGGGL
jgi:mannosyltransferase